MSPIIQLQGFIAGGGGAEAELLSTASGIASNSQTATVTSAASAGSLLVLLAAANSDEDYSSNTDGFSVVQSDRGCIVLSKTASGSEGNITVTWNDDQKLALGLFEFSNAVIDGSGVDSAKSGDTTVPSHTFPASGGFTIVGVSNTNNNDLIALPSGWTQVFRGTTSNRSSLIAYREESAGASAAQTFSVGGDDLTSVWAYIVAA